MRNVTRFTRFACWVLIAFLFIFCLQTWSQVVFGLLSQITYVPFVKLLNQVPGIGWFVRSLGYIASDVVALVLAYLVNLGQVQGFLNPIAFADDRQGWYRQKGSMALCFAIEFVFGIQTHKVYLGDVWSIGLFPPIINTSLVDWNALGYLVVFLFSVEVVCSFMKKLFGWTPLTGYVRD